jgi:hypothetical protein
MATYIIKKNNVFTMNRGDTATMNFNVNVELPEDVIIDKLYLGITEPNQYFEDALIKKTFEINKDITITDENNIWSFSIQIDPEDTVDIIPGTYYYEVKASGVIDKNEERIDFATTIVQKTKFIIVE